MVSAFTAGLVGVPVVFLSGDAALCEEAQGLVPGLSTVAVLRGVGDSTVSIHPHLAVDQIRAGVEAALKADVARCRVPLPDHFVVELRYKDHASAYRASFFPGVQGVGPHTVEFQADDWFEVLRFFGFCVT
jgi:D-amino peptidase